MHHSLNPDEALKELGSGPGGLSDNEAERRLAQYGYNEFGKGKRRTVLDLFIDQFRNYILVLLIIAAAIAYAIGETDNALGIGVVVVLNVLFGMALEYRADRSMDELKKLAETKAVVLRGGRKDFIDSRLLVPGDIIYIEEGAKVPADARLLEEHGVEVNEASLTGESMPVRKNIGKVAPETPIAERSCMLFAGTFVAHGNAKALVVATGRNTEFGKVEQSLGSVEDEETTLEKTISELGRAITIAAFVIAGVFFATGMAFGKWKVEDLFIYAVSVIVAAVPEGMLTMLTIVLAIGMKNMAKEKALVRRLKSVETLGNITFIATDKTGTITKGRMALVKLYDGRLKDFAELSGTEKALSYAYLCNSAHLTEEGVVGDETDRAFVLAGITKGVNVKHFRQITPQLAFFPFDSVSKIMSGIYEIGGTKVAIVKGAPEEIIKMCSTLDGGKKLVAEARKEIISNLDYLTREGMRVIAVAAGKPEGSKLPKKNLEFLGLLALHDPIRAEVKETIMVCREAGIKVLMMTGDNLATAQRIAKAIGLGSEKEVANWSELERMSDEQLDKVLATVKVIARATPASKLRIVERLVARNEIVAVTGDGVNDAPALKKAHVGVVMGKTGTDVSKEVADLVLMDDDFSTLEKAVEYGRGITTNIMNFLRFQITTNIALVLLSVPYVLGIKIFEPVHILWINLIIDGPPALTLGLEKPHKEIMKEKPKKKAVFIDAEFISSAMNMALFMAGMTLIVYFYYAGTEPAKAVTMAFSTFALMQAFNALNSRSRNGPFYRSLFANRWMVIAIVAVIAFQFAIVSFQPFMTVAGTVALPLRDLIVAFCAAASVLVVGEARKMFLKR